MPTVNLGNPQEVLAIVQHARQRVSRALLQHEQAAEPNGKPNLSDAEFRSTLLGALETLLVVQDAQLQAMIRAMRQSIVPAGSMPIKIGGNSR